MVKFSLLIPTRRPPGLSRLFESIKNTVSNFADIELLVARDEDDKGSKDRINSLLQYYKIKVFSRPRSEWLNEDYYNWLAKEAKGQYIWALADDLVLMQKSWDKTIYNRLEGYLVDKPDRIVCAVIAHNTHFKKENVRIIPSFPLISREAIKAVEFFLPPQLPTWGADIILSRLYGKLHRLLQIEDKCYVNHISFHTEQAVADDVVNRCGILCAKYAKLDDKHNLNKILKTNYIDKKVEYLRNYIREYEIKNNIGENNGMV